VEVVGTRFSFDVSSVESKVVVFEGAVSVQSVQAGADPKTLTAGHQITLLAGGGARVTDPPGVAASQPHADPAGHMAFNSAPLDEVASVVNRAKRNPKIVVLDSAKAHPFTGSIDVSDPEKLVLILERRSELVVTRKGAEVHIRAKSTQ
jgi:ferric-dicitrate binding protein FerR (iron transport regulator)